jgi:hypoxanthine phosphoribosyltransferase
LIWDERMRTFARFSKMHPLESAMSADLEHIRQVMREADCLYTEAEVEAAIAASASRSARTCTTRTRWCSA